MTIDDLDQRTVAARRARELVDDLTSDIGGADHVSTAQAALITRCAVLAAWIEDRETAWLSGQPIETSEWLAAANTLKRLLCAVGLHRVARPVPTLTEYLASLADDQLEDTDAQAEAD